jgi:hypothetical protein
MARLAAAVTIAFAVAAPAPASARTVDNFCTELRRIVLAADDRPAFQSLSSAAPNLGFGRPCLILDDRQGRRLSCYRYYAPAELNAANLAAATRRCLPNARPAANEGRPGTTQFRVGRVRISIEETGTPESHIGRQVYYTVTRE